VSDRRFGGAKRGQGAEDGADQEERGVFHGKEGSRILRPRRSGPKEIEGRRRIGSDGGVF